MVPTRWILNRGGVISKSRRTEDPLPLLVSLTDIQNYKNIQGELTATANRLSHLLINLQTGVLLEDENGRGSAESPIKNSPIFFSYPGSPGNSGWY